MVKTVHHGNIWILLDKNGKIIEDIDTDQIYHNAFLYITEIAQMGQYALGNLEGWKDFSKKCRPGDIVVTGRNFGAGSSRQQAVDCFIALQVGTILAPSFGAIYFRNAVNSGFPVVKIHDLENLLEEKKLETGDAIEVDFLKGTALNLTQNILFKVEPMSAVQFDIYKAGDLFKYGKNLARE